MRRNVHSTEEERNEKKKDFVFFQKNKRGEEKG